jgi:hypothetical protein
MDSVNPLIFFSPLITGLGISGIYCRTKTASIHPPAIQIEQSLNAVLVSMWPYALVYVHDVNSNIKVIPWRGREQRNL